MIRAIRKSRNMTQEELASSLNVSRTAVTMWETGQSLPRTELLPRLAEILGCTVDELLVKEKASPSGEGEVGCGDVAL